MASYSFLSGIILVCAIFIVTAAEGKITRCPNAADIQSDYVKNHFNMTKFEGVYYELAYHDYTQPNFCRCQKANKKFYPEENLLLDMFSIECVGGTYMNPLKFTPDDKTKGVFNGKWDYTPGINFPDTVVEVGVAKNAAGEDYYTWALEFQCVEVFNHIVFVGINFYSREKEDKYAQEMLAASEKYGLHQWVTEDQLKIVDHTNCTYPGDDIFTAYEKETLKGGSSAYPLFTTKVLGLDPERNHEEREESGDGDSDSTVKITSV